METLGTFSDSSLSSINNASLLQIPSLRKNTLAFLTQRRNAGFLVKRFSTISSRRVEIYEEEDEFVGGCCGLFRNLRFIRGEHESDAKVSISFVGHIISVISALQLTIHK